MAHLFRFYITPETATTECMALDPEEAHHAARVVRAQQGDAVVLFDGQGRLIHGAVESISKRDVIIRVNAEEVVRRSARRFTLVQAWLHRDKAIEQLVRQGTALGITAIRFYRADRSDKRPKDNPKWDRLAIEACKQCGRPWLPEFTTHDSLADALDSPTGSIIAATDSDDAVAVGQLQLDGGQATLVVGPEGDFTDGERAVLRDRGAISLSLGSTIYRSETAAILGSILLLNRLGEYQ